MIWTAECIFNFPEDKLWGHGHVHYGFHDSSGNRYFFHYFANWIGRIGDDDEFIWTAGANPDAQTRRHIAADLENPIFLTEGAEGNLLVSCAGSAKIFELNPREATARLLIDGRALGMKDISSCVIDPGGNLWVSEIIGCRIWCLDPTGRVIRTVGTGETGFQSGTVPTGEARFGWIYVMLLGPDGHLYILDSTNFAVRRLDLQAETVETIVGTGKPGYSGDGGDATKATLGGAIEEKFCGPYGLRLDGRGNLFIADTDNHVIRMVDRDSWVISTIAGRSNIVPHQRNDPGETDPLRLNIPKASALDYYGGRLFIPEWDGDLIVLKKSAED